MPNWCKGDLKIRSTKANIERFLIEGLQSITYFGDNTKEAEIIKTEYDLTIKTDKNNFWVKGTRRQFIERDIINFYYPDTEEETTVFVLEGYAGAWAIDSKGLANLSKEFNVDFKIYGFERGMEFNQDVEIIAGEIITDNEITFDDYQWECISPELGG